MVGRKEIQKYIFVPEIQNYKNLEHFIMTNELINTVDCTNKCCCDLSLSMYYEIKAQFSYKRRKIAAWQIFIITYEIVLQLNWHFNCRFILKIISVMRIYHEIQERCKWWRRSKVGCCRRGEDLLDYSISTVVVNVALETRYCSST